MGRSVFLQTIIKVIPDRAILERYKQLVFSTESLLELVKYKQFNTLIVSKHLGDIVGCLVQVAHAPLLKPKEGVDENKDDVKDIEVKEGAFVMTTELYERLSQDQVRFKSELDR